MDKNLRSDCWYRQQCRQRAAAVSEQKIVLACAYGLVVVYGGLTGLPSSSLYQACNPPWPPNSTYV